MIKLDKRTRRHIKDLCHLFLRQSKVVSGFYKMPVKEPSKNALAEFSHSMCLLSSEFNRILEIPKQVNHELHLRL